MRVFLTTRTCKTMRRAWTLLEILVAMGIIAVLTGSLLIGSRVVNSSRRGATARQQLQLIAAAIDRYAEFWPKWKIGSVTIADKGWPDAVPGRVFATCTSTFGPFEEVMGFNDSVDFTSPADWIDMTGNIFNANICLSYQLRASSGKGPFIEDPRGVNLVTSETLVAVGSPRILLPGFDTSCVASGGVARSAEAFVDPWESPIRYFWVYRESNRTSPTSHRGYLPVDFAPITTGSGGYGVANPGFAQPDGSLKTAVGYVLESAGPDKKFGNIWKINPTAQEIADAEDNVMITRP